MFRNELFELLQYNPTTKTAHETPLLIFPPWINKFYILDLQPKNSLVRWAVDRGYTVFVVSWVNPDPSLAEKSFEDYMREGIFAALDAVEKATGQRQVNTIGYCIAGTLLAATLAYIAASGEYKNRIKSATFLAAQVDFSEAGDLQVFVDECRSHRHGKADARGRACSRAQDWLTLCCAPTI
jgi:polyhydroxyalkanoate synthase